MREVGGGSNQQKQPYRRKLEGALNTNINMNYLPKDPAILVSSVNMLLRDGEFDSLESLCYSFNEDPKDIKKRLIANGYVYSEAQKQFRPEGYDR